MRSPRYGVAHPYRRDFLVLYGLSLRHVSSVYCSLGEILGWRRYLRCGSLLRSLADPTPVGGPPSIRGPGAVWLADSPQIDGAGFGVVLPAENALPGEGQKLRRLRRRE